jgi:tetratricopeptide (TPR) repeat protein
MKRIANLPILVVVFTVGLFVQVSDISAQSRNSITGFVFNETRQPVADIYVELLDDLYVTISRTKTSGSGLYSFRNLTDGRYVVKVLPYGKDYEEESRSISLVSVSALPGSGGISEQIDFYLKTKRITNEGPLAAPGVIFAQEIPNNAKKLYEDGIEDLGNKKENEGFDKLKQALEIFPDYYLALDRLGREYVVRGYYQASFVLFTKAIEVNPRSYSSTFGLGLSLYRLQEVDRAIKTLQRATEIDNKQVNGFLWLGISYLHQKDYSQAETALNKANKLSNGESPDVHWQLARLYKDQNRFNESADSLELYLKHNSETGDTEKIKATIKTLRQKAKSS